MEFSVQNDLSACQMIDVESKMIRIFGKRGKYVSSMGELKIVTLSFPFCASIFMYDTITTSSIVPDTRRQPSKGAVRDPHYQDSEMVFAPHSQKEGCYCKTDSVSGSAVVCGRCSQA
jgi:hypothetical protein